MSPFLQILQRRRESRVLAVASPERIEDGDQSAGICVVDFDERVDIERRDRRSLEHRGDSADDDVLDAVTIEQL